MPDRIIIKNEILKERVLKFRKSKKEEYEDRKKQFKDSSKKPRMAKKGSEPLLRIGAKNPYALIAGSHEFWIAKGMREGLYRQDVYSSMGDNKTGKIKAVFSGIPEYSSRQYITDLLCTPVMLANDDKPPLDKLKFEHLFDPVYRSQLFCYGDDRRGHVIKNKPESRDHLKTQAGSVVECENLDIGLGCPKDPTGQPAPVSDQNKPFLVDDPIQGAVPDCWIIAALSSLAWVYPFPISTCGDFGWIFLGNPETWDYSETAPTSDLPMNGDKLAGAKSSDSSVTWPAQYELAMARFLGSYGEDDPKSICRIPPGDPQFALACLMFGSYDQNCRVTLNPNSVTNLANNGVITDRMKSLFVQAGLNHHGFSWITQYPTVAWTYCSGDTKLVLPVSFHNNPIGIASGGVQYEDDILVANHSYSLLGLCADKSDKLYVVLRNPYGWDSIYGPARYNLNTSAKLQLNPNDPSSIQQITYTDSANNTCIRHGVFALDIDDFVKYFAGFGWVPC
jgi:hypothetical protein